MDRRTILKAAGISLLLPNLESFGEVKEKKVKRLFTVVNHLSFYQPALIPKKTGAFSETPILLENLKDHFNELKLFSSFDNPGVQLGLGHTPCVGRQETPVCAKLKSISCAHFRHTRQRNMGVAL